MKRKIFIVKSRTPEKRDASKLGKIYGKLKRLSVQKAKQETKALQVAQPRNAPVAVNPRTKVTLNVKGNLRGMHVAGDSEQMKKIRAMRRFYNKKMPVLNCSTCAFASTCPQFKAGYECAYLPFLNAHKIETERDLLEAAKELCSANMHRMHLASLMETLSGGMPSVETTEAMNMVFMQLAKLKEMTDQANEASLSIETEDEGIVSRIFGGFNGLLNSTRQAQENPIEVLPEQLQLSNNPLDVDAILEDKSSGDINQELLREHARDEVGAVISNEAMPVIAVSNLEKKA